MTVGWGTADGGDREPVPVVVVLPVRNASPLPAWVVVTTAPMITTASRVVDGTRASTEPRQTITTVISGRPTRPRGTTDHVDRATDAEIHRHESRVRSAPRWVRRPEVGPHPLLASVKKIIRPSTVVQVCPDLRPGRAAHLVRCSTPRAPSPRRGLSVRFPMYLAA
jgi:hypothetical protein